MCTKGQAVGILGEVYRDCKRIFGDVRDAYLYGSYARGDYTAESDVDILLTVDLSQEEIAKRRADVAGVASELSLKHDVTVSVTVKPFAQFEMYRDSAPYYKNVVKEGIRYAV